MQMMGTLAAGFFPPTQLAKKESKINKWEDNSWLIFWENMIRQTIKITFFFFWLLKENEIQNEEGGR